MAIHKKGPDNFEWQLRRARTNACSKQVGDKRGKSQIGQTVRPAAEESLTFNHKGTTSTGHAQATRHRRRFGRET
jgi:hypothetical protein